MKIRQVLLLAAIALICGGIAGRGSARLADSGKDNKSPATAVTDQTILTVRQLRFVDASGKLRATLELGRGSDTGLVLKDPSGRSLYELPPALKVIPLRK